MADVYFFKAIKDSFYLQVCRRLYALGTLPSLWRHFNLKVKFKKKESHRVLFIAQTLKRVTGIYRYVGGSTNQAQCHLFVSGCPTWPTLTSVIMISLPWTPNFSPGPLIPSRIATLDTLTSPQNRWMLPQVFFEIFKNVAQVSVLFSWMDVETRLKKLNIRGNSLKSVPPELLAKLLNRFSSQFHDCQMI